MGKGNPAVIATVHERVPGGGKGGTMNEMARCNDGQLKICGAVRVTV